MRTLFGIEIGNFVLAKGEQCVVALRPLLVLKFSGSEVTIEACTAFECTN